jgi:hypothetical protein
MRDGQTLGHTWIKEMNIDNVQKLKLFFVLLIEEA